MAEGRYSSSAVVLGLSDEHDLEMVAPTGELVWSLTQGGGGDDEDDENEKEIMGKKPKQEVKEKKKDTKKKENS